MRVSECKIIGIDEVGRGCLAGPLLVVAARQKSKLPKDIKDSKKLTRGQRETIYQLLTASCQFGEGWVTPAEINRLGLTGATRLGVKRALKALSAGADNEILIDGHINYCPSHYKSVKTIIGGDDLIPIISAASIYAKVRRDAYMKNASRKYAGYGFDKHVGYGTKLHLAAIAELGVLDSFHRLNYAPIKEVLAGL